MGLAEHDRLLAVDSPVLRVQGQRFAAHQDRGIVRGVEQEFHVFIQGDLGLPDFPVPSRGRGIFERGVEPMQTGGVEIQDFTAGILVQPFGGDFVKQLSFQVPDPVAYLKVTVFGDSFVGSQGGFLRSRSAGQDPQADDDGQRQQQGQ